VLTWVTEWLLLQLLCKCACHCVSGWS